jgi:hypothetical protein
LHFQKTLQIAFACYPAWSSMGILHLWVQRETHPGLIFVYFVPRLAELFWMLFAKFVLGAL